MNPRRIKVLFLDHAPVMGGAEHSLLDILAGLGDGPVQPVLLAPRQGKLYGRAEELGIPVIDFSWEGGILSAKRKDLESNPMLVVSGLPKAAGVVWQISKLLRRGGFDVIYTNTLKSHILGGLAGKLAGVRVIWHFRDIPVQRLSRLISRAGAATLPDRIIAVSQAVAAQFGRGRTTVIYNGFERGRILQLAEGQLPEQLPGRQWLNEKGPVIGLVGQISRWKGQDVFLRAVSLLAEKHPEARFLIVGGAIFGEDDFRRKLESLVAAGGLGGKVAFTGHLENPYPLMKRLAVLVHCPVEPEPFGRVLVESLILGVPVVAARAGAAAEIIDEGVNGILVPPGDAEALARGVERIWAGRLSITEMRGSGRPDISNKYSLGTAVTAIEKEIIEVIRAQ
jgi:glycosyltransferase involved in cell wall biosynthesis